MAGFNGAPPIVTDGLITYFDSYNHESLPGGSDNWYDLILGRSVGFVNDNNITTLDGVKTVRNNSGLDQNNFYETTDTFLPYLNATLEAWIYPENEVTTGDRGTIILMTGTRGLYMSWNKSSRKLSTYWYGRSPSGYFETGAAMERYKWHHICSVHNNDEQKVHQYTNGVKTTINNVTADSTNYNTSKTGTKLILRQENTNRAFSGGISMVRIYNKALTEEQVLYNYNSTKSRYQ